MVADVKRQTTEAQEATSSSTGVVGEHPPTKRSAAVPRRRSQIPIKIENRSYAKLADQPLFVTPELKEALEKRRLKDGTTLFDNLRQMGFRGGKHLLEMIRTQLGSDCAVILSHEPCSLGKRRVVIAYEAFRESGQQLFFQVYRQTGLRTATRFLNEAFPSRFMTTEADILPESSTVRRVLGHLPEAALSLTKKERARLPAQIAELVERQGSDFVVALLSSVDAAIPRGQERIRVAFQDVIKRLSKEPARALQELADLMDHWNLLQVTSLVNVLKARLNTIETFEALIVDDNTYELREDKSIHRTLEKSMWLLDDEFWIAQANRTLRLLIAKELAKEDQRHAQRRPDFACVDAVGRTVLVEIKRPSLELRKPEVDQAELYIRLVRKHRGDRKRPTIFLIGRRISDEAHELAEMRGYPVLMTYQELAENCRRRYQEYLKIVEAGR